jgi:putative peptidoglycan lipid II flippase
VATVTLAEVARHAAAKNMADLKETLAFSLGLVLFLTVPATIALVVMARPIIALLYEHGRFTPTDTIQTARALWGYGVGLAAFSAVRVMVPAFYSLGLARIPVMVSIGSIAATVVLYFVLMGPFQHAGLALATSMGSVMNFIVLAWMLRRRIGGIGGRTLAVSAVKILVSGILAGVLAWLVTSRIESAIGLRSVAERLIVVGAGLAVGTFAYFIAARALRVRELEAIVSRVRRT